MTRLVDDLLDVSRITTGKLVVRKSVLDLADPLRDAIEIARPTIDFRGHTLEVDLPAVPTPIEGDRTRLAQVFSNLLNNAAKYTPKGGRIRLSVGQENGDAVVRIVDSGIGLDPLSMGRIFDMFVQVDVSLDRSTAGLGVGLTLARRLVQLHGGTLEAESPGAGQGSTFTVRLPTSGLHLDDETVARQASGVRASARRVLLADDNKDFANSLGELIGAGGHAVRIVHDGEEAVEAAATFKPDVAFVDIGMPKLHGYDVARRLRADPATAKCILVAVTGWGQDNDRRLAREAGFDRHLTKPVNPADIEAILGA
jgi:CheY-like chemotaxis protein/two-component sensor histidine kinase